MPMIEQSRLGTVLLRLGENLPDAASFIVARLGSAVCHSNTCRLPALAG